MSDKIRTPETEAVAWKYANADGFDHDEEVEIYKLAWNLERRLVVAVGALDFYALMFARAAAALEEIAALKAEIPGGGHK